VNIAQKAQMELIVFIGIQATGKSSFFFARFRDTHVRINRDMLRTRHRERALFEACLEGKIDVVVDNTNPSRADRRTYIEPARAAGFQVIGYFFQSSLAPALERNAQRSGDARIPDSGLRDAQRRLELPTREEGFDELYFVRLRDGGDFHVEEWTE